MSDFESIIDQKQPIGILTTLLRSKNIPHALLFTGIEGVGKHNAAITFAMACNCISLDSGQLSEYETHSNNAIHKGNELPSSSVPCGYCTSCKKIRSESHPDILSIIPAGSFIKIDQIRALYQTLAMKPYEAKYRVVIMSEAQRMNSASSNAFLKILEEPPDRTILILIAKEKSDLLETVVSRCQHIKFNPIPRNILCMMLSEKEHKPPEDALVLATMSKGSLSKAITMIRTDWIQRRNWLLNLIGLDQHELVESRPSGLLFSISAQLSENKDALEDYMETIMSWLRDLIIFKYQPDKIIHKDIANKVENVSKKFTIKSLLHKIEAVQAAQLMIQRPNANVRLSLDILLNKLIETVN